MKAQSSYARAAHGIDPFGDAPVSAEEPPPIPSRDQRIAEAAYYRFERRGQSAGDALQDWLDAEAEIDGPRERTGGASPA